MKSTIVKWMGLAAAMLISISCKDQLDLYPKYGLSSEQVYKNLEGYRLSLAKLYGGFALSGQDGPAGNSDVTGDEGFSQFMRAFWQLQELPTDEAKIRWVDQTLQDINTATWTTSDVFVRQMYARCYFSITLANSFMEEAGDDRLSRRGIGGDDATEVRYFRAEARMVRALCYWVLLDLYGNVPFSTGITSEPPPQIKRKELFEYVEKELLETEPLLKAPRSNEYGRFDKGACWALLARLYLNAEVYTSVPDGAGNPGTPGTARWNDAVTWSRKVIDEGGYSLHNNYRELMLTDNNRLTNEFLWTINNDATLSQNFGLTTYLVNASNGTLTYKFDLPGISQDIEYGTIGWNGLVVVPNLVMLFPDSGKTGDLRAQFLSKGLENNRLVTRPFEIQTLPNTNDGWRSWKYRNISSTGAPDGNPANNEMVDSDYPFFRLAEQFLIYAEATARGGNGNMGDATRYINLLRERAYAGTAQGQVTEADVTPRFVLDERARELYWEGHRRTDLIRFGLFAGDEYLWPFKGGAVQGTGIPAYRNLYPIPQTDKQANTKLVQNPGYGG